MEEFLHNCSQKENIMENPCRLSDNILVSVKKIEVQGDRGLKPLGSSHQQSESLNRHLQQGPERKKYMCQTGVEG